MIEPLSSRLFTEYNGAVWPEMEWMHERQSNDWIIYIIWGILLVTYSKNYRCNLFDKI